MTVLLDHPRPDGGIRVLILGGAAYPAAHGGDRRVPVLDDISSAATSAIEFAKRVLGPWSSMFAKPLASVQALINQPTTPGGATWVGPDGAWTAVNAPALEAIKEARRLWLAGAGPNDTLIFYCCGHGIWLPKSGRTFLATDFGSDPDAPWDCAIALDDLQLALGEKAPRIQWLIYDCCANTPTEAMRASPNPTQLLTPIVGGRAAAEQQWGALAQVRVATASPGAMAFGKDGKPSRFMEAFINACDGAGFQWQGDDGRWWIDPAGLDKAIGTYALRCPALEDEKYYTFPKAIETDAASPPGLMVRDEAAECTLLVQTLPGIRLKTGNLTISIPNGQEFCTVKEQIGGTKAETPFRWSAKPFVSYRLDFAFDGQSTRRTVFALPPLAKAMF